MTNYGAHDGGDHKAKTTLALDLFLKARFDSDGRGDGQPVYIGYAEPGTATSEEKWAIKKLTYTGSIVTAIDWAGSSNQFNKEWDERTSYSYG